MDEKLEDKVIFPFRSHIESERNGDELTFLKLRSYLKINSIEIKRVIRISLDFYSCLEYDVNKAGGIGKILQLVEFEN